MIGSIIEVIDADNKDLIGIKGKIIDETKNTLLVQTIKGRKRLLKNQIVFTTKNTTRSMIIDGKKIMRRPHDRIR